MLRFEWVGDMLASIAAVALSTFGLIKVRLELLEADRLLVGNDRGGLDFAALWFIGAGALVTMLAGGWRVAVGIHKARREDDRQSPSDVYACCAMMYAGLQLIHKPGPNDGLRITVYRVHEAPKGKKDKDGCLEQLIPYAGGVGGQVGRRFPLQCGVIGRVVRTGEPVGATRVSKDIEEFWREMQGEWGFMRDEAKNLDLSRWSWFAVPMLEKRRVVGVVYLDAAEPLYFHDERKAAIMEYVSAMTEYVLRRYP